MLIMILLQAVAADVNMERYLSQFALWYISETLSDGLANWSAALGAYRDIDQASMGYVQVELYIENG